MKTDIQLIFEEGYEYVSDVTGVSITKDTIALTYSKNIISNDNVWSMDITNRKLLKIQTDDGSHDKYFNEQIERLFKSNKKSTLTDIPEKCNTCSIISPYVSDCLECQKISESETIDE